MFALLDMHLYWFSSHRMVKLQDACATVSQAVIVALECAAPTMKIVGLAVPGVGDALEFLVGSIAEQVRASGSNNKQLLNIEKRASEVLILLDTLKEADFPEECPAFVHLLEAMAGQATLARKWADMSWASRNLSFSLRNGTTTAFKYREEFATGATLVDAACEELLDSVAIETFTGIHNLRVKFASDAEDRRREYADIAAAQGLHTQSLEALQASVNALAEENRLAEARAEQHLLELTSKLSTEIKAALSTGCGGASVRTVATAAAQRAARDLGLGDTRALEQDMLEVARQTIDAVERDGGMTRAKLEGFRAEVEDANRNIRDQLDEVLARLGDGGPLRPTDGLEKSLAKFLESEGLDQLGGFFLRCGVRSLHALATVPEADMHELGLSPLHSSRVAALMKHDHPMCPLLASGGSGDLRLPPAPPFRLRPVLDCEHLSPLLLAVLDNPAADIGPEQSLDVVLQLVAEGADQAKKARGVTAAIFIGFTGELRTALSITGRNCGAIKKYLMDCGASCNLHRPSFDH